MIIESRAYARAGLLGNPSDGYFGKTISISVRNFGAHVSLYQTPELHIEPADQDVGIFRNIYHLVESVSLTGYYGGTRLIKAAIKKFTEHCEQNNIKLSAKNFTIRYYTSIPRQVGLAGSSAIITATIRALMRFYQVKIPLEILPNIVLAAEAEELGINAGLQDRVIQAYEGCVYMDFDEKKFKRKGHGEYICLKPELLPKLYIAYKTDLGKVSGKVLNDIRTRYDRGDQSVIDTLKEIADLATTGKTAIENQDVVTLNELINRNFDLRTKIMNISESNMELVNTARECGASAKFTGSGGSIIGIYTDDEMLTRLIIELKKINARVIKPYIV
ncbi:GHMP kinase [candidate division KSB1 bacterium]|nr:GHMP kinase [candidate division KSB1 bacterium]